MSLEGRLEDLGLSDIFQIISLSKRSGVLTLIRKEGTGRLVFTQGHVIYATSDTRSRLGYTLVKKGIVTNDDLEYALRVQKGRGSMKPIGTLLLEMGAIDQETLEREIREHIIFIVKDLLSWNTGSFHFELGPATEEEVVLRQGLNTEFLLLEGARLQDEEQKTKAEPVPPKPVPAASTPKGPDDLEMTQVAPPLRSSETMPVRPSIDSTPPSKPSSSASHKGGPAEEPSSPSPSGTSPGPAGNRKDLMLLTSMIAELSGPSTSSEITLLVLRFASEIMNRAVILLVRKDDIVGLGQFGLILPEGSPQERVRSISIPLSDSSVFREVIEKKATYKSQLPQSKWHQYFVDQLGKEWPSEIFVAPLICEGRVIAILYGDNIPRKEKIGDTEGLEAFIKVTGFAFGKALLERKLHDTQSSRP
ncbi:MAG: DUF4388 domain-containing protein [Nitrospirae bacterium]|nr:DUF4388 domain-containing protein [Nitrospirota bacterium]